MCDCVVCICIFKLGYVDKKKKEQKGLTRILLHRNLIVVKAPELHTIKSTLGFHLNLLGHQPVFVIDHRKHMVVLILVLEFERSICLELLLNLLQQFLKRCVDPDKNRPRVNVMALHAKLIV